MSFSLKSSFAIDLRTLAFFRVALAGMLIWDLFDRARTLRMLYTDDGVLSRDALLSLYGQSMQWTTLHFVTGQSVLAQGLMFGLAGVIAIALMVGYRTWWATFLSWVLLVSLDRRLPHAAGIGSDYIMRLMLFWSLFLPLGARWSLDQLRDRTQPVANPLRNFATAAILLQVCYVYWFTAIWKLYPDWLEGTAVGHAMRLDAYARPLGQFLGEQESITVLLTYAALATEAFIPLIALSPFANSLCRWLAIIAMFGLHLGIAASMYIGLFPYVSMVSWLLFMPTSFWDWLENRQVFRQVIAKDRESVEAMLESRRPINWLSDAKTGFVVGVFVLVTFYNIFGLPQLQSRGVRIPKLVELGAKLLRVNQEWAMFAPSANSYDGWFVMPAELPDGTVVDLWTGLAFTYEKPKLVSSLYVNARVRQFMNHYRTSPDTAVWHGFARYYAKCWNEEHPDRRIRKMEIAFIGEREHNGDTERAILTRYAPAEDTAAPTTP